MTDDAPFFVNRKYPDASPESAVQRLMDAGYSATEIAWALLIPVWLVRERFAFRAGQYDRERLSA